MASVINARDHAGQYRRSLVVSAAAHLLLLLALSSSLILIPHQPIQRRAIDAFVVNENTFRQTSAVDKKPLQPAQPEAPPTPLPEPIKPEVEQKAAEAEVKAEAERKEQERKAAEAKIKVEKEKKEQERKAAEAKAKAEAEKKEQERKAAEAKAKAEAERKAAEAKAQAAKQEQARRQAELAAAMAAEEDLWAAQNSGEMDRYIALIQQKVERNWVPPASAQVGLECEVAVVQLPNGDVVDARTVRCNGDAAVQRSIEAAVRRSSPLPLPDNRALFERNLRFIFKPEQ